jgi:hypothetical protein
MRFPFLLMLLGLPGVAAAADSPVRELADGEAVEWIAADSPAPVHYRAGDIALTLRGEATGPELVQPVLTVAMPGLPPVTVEGSEASAGIPHHVSVGRWDAARRYVLFQSFSGGAHCCNQIQVVLPGAGRAMVVDLGAWDGDYIDPPRDEDGDGTPDFVLYDNAFLYAFSSYAGSWAPPKIFDIVDGVPADVSAHPAFRPLFEENMAQAREACLDPQNTEHNGACAGYVADAARLGRFDAAWAEMLDHYDRDAGDGFPGTRMEGAGDYPAALRQFLIEQGYIAE